MPTNASHRTPTALPKAGVKRSETTDLPFVLPAIAQDGLSTARNGEALDQQLATVTVGGLKVEASMNSVWGTTYAPIPAGTYTVLVPDAPHNANMTRFYRNVAPTLKSDQIWFSIKYGYNSRYVHVGNLSEGCTTILTLEKWADIAEALISHRGPDGRSVGQLVVKSTPERAQ